MKVKLTRIALVVSLMFNLMVTVFVANTVDNAAQSNTVQQMEQYTVQQMEQIESFLRSQKQRLVDYSESEDIKNVFRESIALASEKPEAVEFKTAQGVAQKFCEAVSHTRENGGVDESFFVSTWEAEILAHTNSEIVGTEIYSKIFIHRLQKSLLKGGNDDVYNAGISISPIGNHEQVLSFYKTVYDDDGVSIGLIGLNIFTDEIQSQLKLDIQGIPNAVHSLVDVASDTYLFKSDEPVRLPNDSGGYDYLTVTSPEIKYALNLYKDLNSGTLEPYDYTQYFNHVAFYSYSEEYKWFYIIEGDAQDIFSFYLNMKGMTVFVATLAFTQLFIVGIVIMVSDKPKKKPNKL